MILEIAEIEIKAGKEDAFHAAMREGAMANLAACKGVIEARIGRGIENPSKFLFHVWWTSLEAHTAAYELESFAKFRVIIEEMMQGAAMSHYVLDEATAGA